MRFEIRLPKNFDSSTLQRKIAWSQANISETSEAVLVYGNVSYPVYVNILYLCRLAVDGPIKILLGEEGDG